MSLFPSRPRAAMVLVIVTIGRGSLARGVDEISEGQPSAADLVREVHAAEAWIRQVDSCLIRAEMVQSKPSRSRDPDSNLDEIRDRRGWQEAEHGTHEVAWDRSRVRVVLHYPGRKWRMVSAWDGRILTVHEKAPWRDREIFGIYDDSRRETLLTLRVNLWDYGGLVTNDTNAWWRTADQTEHRLVNFESPEDFRDAGKGPVDGRDCRVVESRAGGLRLYIDAVDRRVRRITHFVLPNDLDEAVRLAAMRKAAAVELKTARDWTPWVEALGPEARLDARRRLSENLFPSMRVRTEIYPAGYVEVVPGGWMPRRFTAISRYPDWDAVEKTGRYTYVVDRVDITVTELKVNEALSDETLTIRIPEGGKVFDWRFDPPAEYEFRKDMGEDGIRAHAEDAKRKHDERMAPHREMVARIEKNVGRDAPELPRATWFNGGPPKLGDLRGRVILLHFWATWCAPCHAEIRTLVRLKKTAASDPLVIGVHDARADARAIEKAIAAEGIRYPVCIDVSRDGDDGISQRSWYGVHGIPYTLLIDKQGRVASHGALEDMLEKARGME
jgi:thiol-disulfide isomerase/thioredoxin